MREARPAPDHAADSAGVQAAELAAGGHAAQLAAERSSGTVRAARRLRRLGPALALAASSALASCVNVRGEAPVLFASEPPGARVLVDGVDSGFATPCHLGLARGDRHRIDLVLPGHRPATRLLEPGVAVWTIEWDEMLAFPNTWRFPLWLNGGDLFRPVRVTRAPSPSRVFVDLERATGS